MPGASMLSGSTAPLGVGCRVVHVLHVAHVHRPANTTPLTPVAPNSSPYQWDSFLLWLSDIDERPFFCVRQSHREAPANFQMVVRATGL